MLKTIKFSKFGLTASLPLTHAPIHFFKLTVRKYADNVSQNSNVHVLKVGETKKSKSLQVSYC